MTTIDSWYILLPAFILFLLYLFFATSYRKGQYFLIITFVIYLSAVIHLVFFPIEIYEVQNSTQPLWQQMLNEVNFIPILTIDIFSFVLNVVMFIPLGVYLPLVSSKVTSAGKAAKYGFFLSLFIEVIQLLMEVTWGSGRIEDINDIIANTLGAVVGYLIISKFAKIKQLEPLVSKISLGENFPLIHTEDHKKQI